MAGDADRIKELLEGGTGDEQEEEIPGIFEKYSSGDEFDAFIRGMNSTKMNGDSVLKRYEKGLFDLPHLWLVAQ